MAGFWQKVLLSLLAAAMTAAYAAGDLYAATTVADEGEYNVTINYKDSTSFNMFTLPVLII